MLPADGPASEEFIEVRTALEGYKEAGLLYDVEK